MVFAVFIFFPWQNIITYMDVKWKQFHNRENKSVEISQSYF